MAGRCAIQGARRLQATLTRRCALHLRQLFYYLVTSERGYDSDPLVLWLNGALPRRALCAVLAELTRPLP